MKKLGTVWVAPGEGATFKDFTEVMTPEQINQIKVVVPQKISIYFNLKTNLALTGEPLTNYDLYRIEVCI